MAIVLGLNEMAGIPLFVRMIITENPEELIFLKYPGFIR